MLVREYNSRILLFLIGLGSMTQVHFLGSIGISEIFMYIAAPFILLRDFKQLREDGFGGFLLIVFLVCVGCVIASLCNETPFMFFLKGFAFPYSIMAVSVVFHRLLRRDFSSLRWLLFGLFLSNIVCVFVFQPETYVVRNGYMAVGDEAVEAMVAHPQFWAKRITELLRLPIECWYLQTPFVYSAMIPIVTAIVQIAMSNASGRAGAIVGLLGACLIIMGGKKRRTIAKIGHYIWVLLILGVVVMMGFKFAYSKAAASGILGDRVREKYLEQTAGGTSALKMLMAGRKEAFIGLFAALDRPIIGHGPKAEDRNGYVQDFLSRYGTLDEYYIFLKTLKADDARGYVYRTIPAHSHIIGFWLFYGVFGLVYWIYIYWLMYKYLRVYAKAIPQWFGFLSLSCAGWVWSIPFNPYGFRVAEVVPIVCILFARAVYNGRIMLPPSMESEIGKYER